MNTEEKQSSKSDLEHFLKLANAQVRHRMKQAEGTDAKGPDAKALATLRALQLLEDLIKEQVQA